MTSSISISGSTDASAEAFLTMEAGDPPEHSLGIRSTNTPETSSAVVVSDDEGSIRNVLPQPPAPLQFEFRGYSVWLELEQVQDRDLDRALDAAAHDLHVHRVPGPHVTVEYGILLPAGRTELELRRRFRDYCTSTTNGWPAMTVRGVQTGSTYDGVDGEEMTMAWIELTLATSPAHEVQVEAVRRALVPHYQPRTRKWTPHLSLCYENPQQAKSNLHYSLTLLQRVPTLTSLAQRRVTGIALWKTQGKMEDWKCLERVVLGDYNCEQEVDDPMLMAGV